MESIEKKADVKMAIQEEIFIRFDGANSVEVCGGDLLELLKYLKKSRRSLTF